ncbi:S1C family serine protease [Demetria terragena]|uniref:S1C family serine protease n=1 Tax=Demetria terragena TaxID=63959 RepID=UPI00037F8B85|nr:trypsin-like peptidase domain-containing protein [Demetria terragena]
MNEQRPDETGPQNVESTQPFAAPLPRHQAPQNQSGGDGQAPPQHHSQQPHYGAQPQSGQQPGGPQQSGQPGTNPWAPQHQQAPQAFGAAPPQGPYAPAPVATEPKPRRNRAAVPLAALLAAVLASGGTYALTQGSTSDSSPTAAGNTTVIQGDPADYADAGSVNWSSTAGKVTPSVVAIATANATGGGSGSGVILDDKGNIVTNNHVVAGSQKLQVTLADKREYEASVVGTDPSTDLAVIRIKNPPANLKPVTLGNDDKITVGQPVMAVGNPLGLAGTVTTGIVSALNRPVSTQQEGGGEEENAPGAPGQSQGGEQVVTNAIQTSAAINPGNSGGALVSGGGDLIGINSSIASLSGSSGSSQSGNIGIGFAIPVTVVKNITKQLIADGKAQHPQLGVSATNGSAKFEGATVSGAKVATVVNNSGADKAGIKKDDVILTIDGESVDSSTSLVGQVRERTPGQRVELSVVRDGKRQNVTVTLGTAPSS